MDGIIRLSESQRWSALVHFSSGSMLAFFGVPTFYSYGIIEVGRTVRSWISCFVAQKYSRM